MPVKKYIPKGYPMEAVQFTGDNVKEVADFSGDSFLFSKEDCVWVAVSEDDAKKCSVGGFVFKRPRFPDWVDVADEDFFRGCNDEVEEEK